MQTTHSYRPIPHRAAQILPHEPWTGELRHLQQAPVATIVEVSLGFPYVLSSPQFAGCALKRDPYAMGYIALADFGRALNVVIGEHNVNALHALIKDRWSADARLFCSTCHVTYLYTH